MPTFAEQARTLHERERAREAAATRLHAAREALARIAAEEARLVRSFDERNPASVSRRRALEARRREAEAALQRTRAALERSAAEIEDLRGALLPLADPRKQMREWPVEFPLLMFPLRLETRFVRREIDGEERNQLWVRVYPDECLVDTFEPLPAESELAAVRKFWIDWARAGGHEAQQRGAWALLVAGAGAGRAAWLVEEHAPADRAALPSKPAPEDVVLVVAVQTPVPDAEKPAVAAYWSAFWQADGDADAEAQAFASLEAAVGSARAAEIRASTMPENLAEAPGAGLARSEVSVQTAFLELPDPDQIGTQRQTWSRAPQVRILPERLVLLGWRDGQRVLEQLGNPIPSPLVAGPDPSADPADQIRLEDGDIVVGAEMKWMVDFDEAVRVGMGFRVDLNVDETARGFDQLLVVGVRLSADPDAGKALVEELFEHHARGSTGFSLLPQGAPTNNVEGAGSAFSESEDADDSFALLFAEPIPRTSDWLDRSDAQWLADMLGIDLETFRLTPNARGRDQCEARAMNVALWPATWGYFMETMMAPVFDSDVIASTRSFFTQFVVARGTVPAIRIGDQPYGVLPATAWSRLRWFFADRPGRSDGAAPSPRYLAGLRLLLDAMRNDWRTMAANVPFVGKPGDPHQILLDVLGLHGGSVEFHQRYAESLEQLTNRMKLIGFWGPLLAALTALAYTDGGMRLLQRLGYTQEAIPELLEKFFLQEANKLKGDLIDDQKLSEQNGIRSYTDDGRNYIRWLIDAASTSFDALRRQDGFTDDAPPRALLYLMLRFALEQSYWYTSLRLFELAGELSGEALAVARLDPSFVHVATVGAQPSVAAGAEPAAARAGALATSGKPVRIDQRSESRYEFLYQTSAAVTGSPDRLVADFIPGIIGTHVATEYLTEQLRALEHLERAPTARLERVFAEHIDLCTYRLDAWRWGLLNWRLSEMRYPQASDGGETPARSGVYVGAFGWLTDVRAEARTLTPVELEDSLDKIFDSRGGTGIPPLMRDDTNGGYVHAPSLNHAIAAAILRNGYVANATSANPDTFKVNLSSERVRTALGVIEGIRAGQKLGALLGYRLERGLHDRHAEAEVDKFIYELRKAFPLVADKISDTASEPGDAIESIEARNVVDGYALVKHVKSSGQRNYPFGKPLPAATPAEVAVINAEVDALLDLEDAVADLVMAESVYQTVAGNFSRVASNLDAYAEGTFPPEPEVAQTPRSGIHLTHRLALQLESGLDPTVSPNALAVTPRAFAEPAVNKWIDGLLPPPDDVFCKVSYFDAAAGAARQADVTQADLGLQPLDLMYLVDPESDQAMAALDDRIIGHVLANLGPRWDVPIEIAYTTREAGGVPLFEAGALLRPLRSLVLKSRPLAATDARLTSEAAEQDDEDVHLDATRISTPAGELAGVADSGGAGDDLLTLEGDLAPLLADPAANRDALLAGIDGWIDRVLALFGAGARFGLPGCGIGFAYDWKKRQLQRLHAALDALLERWQAHLDELDRLLDEELPLATTDEERFAILRRAEGHVTTVATAPTPATPADLETIVAGLRTTFAGKRDALAAIGMSSDTTISGFLAAVAAQGSLEAFEHDAIDLRDIEDEVVRFSGELGDRIAAVRADIERRKSEVDALLAEADAAGSSAERVRLRTAAAKKLFGEDFKIVPEFGLPPEQATEWQKCWDDRASLLAYLTDAPPAGLGSPLPVDDWFQGVARVREEARRFETVTLLASAFAGAEPVLTPLQFPYAANDRWLGLEHPDDYAYEGDRLLYTAHYARDFDPTKRQCGLLLDEWTEVIPQREETTGITFHYDRPSSEPPQSLLLVTSPRAEGGWTWEDVVDAIRETFDEARLRAVEPQQVDQTDYARFLPATLASVTRHPITIGLNLALNNQVYRILENGGG